MCLDLPVPVVVIALVDVVRCQLVSVGKVGQQWCGSDDRLDTSAVAGRIKQSVRLTEPLVAIDTVIFEITPDPDFILVVET